MNKKGAKKGVIWVALIIGLVLVYTQTTIIQDLFAKPEVPEVGKCPSSGLTEITINTQEALASSATDSLHEYFIYDKDGVLVTNGNSGGDGQSVFDVKCGVDKKYDAIVLNDSATLGFYSQTFEIDAIDSAFTKNLKTYEYGQVSVSNIGSDADPTGDNNVSSGLGKNCGFTITYTENETASAYNKPLILCQANATGVEDITMTGVTEAKSKKPTRISALITGNEFWVFEVDKLLKSTDAAQKISGKITFSSAITPDDTLGNLTCQIIDQARFKKPEYQTLSLNEGFLLGTEDDSNVDVGGEDSALTSTATLFFQHASGYC